MSMTWFATLSAGLLALVGLGAVFTAFVLRTEPRRSTVFRIGTVGLTLAGLVLMLGSVIGWLGSNEMFGGLMLLVFGTGSSLVPLKATGGTTPERSEP